MTYILILILFFLPFTLHAQEPSPLLLFGSIELHPEKSLHLHAKYPGVVKDVYKSVGDRVQQGEALAQVENNVGVQSSPLISTINGLIIEKNIAVGQSINEEIEAFTIADLSAVMVTLRVYPRDIDRLSLGQKIFLQSSKDDPTAAAEIAYISPLLDDKNRTAKIHVFLKNENGRWRPGQFIIGTLDGKQAHAEAKK
jgi:multidrug efflux pump subunit AcrA (membrane-fusion protein)